MKNSEDRMLALRAGEQASKIVMDGFGRIKKVREKEGRGIVTEVDKRTERTITKILQQGSDYSILGEEEGLTKRSSERRWVIDPLDGTTNYARGLPLFAISIALMHENEVLLGLIACPAFGLTFVAEKEKGAYVNGKTIGVSETPELERSVVFVNHGYAQEDRGRFSRVVGTLSPIAPIRKLGTTALELCYVAQGHADAFLSSGDELWDYAAGILLVREAGGRVTDWKGQSWSKENSFVLASNGKIHEQLVEKLKSRA